MGKRGAEFSAATEVKSHSHGQQRGALGDRRTHTGTIPFATKTRQRHTMLFREADTLCWPLRGKKSKEATTTKFRTLCAQAGGGEVRVGMAGAQGARSGSRGAGFGIAY